MGNAVLGPLAQAGVDVSGLGVNERLRHEAEHLTYHVTGGA